MDESQAKHANPVTKNLSVTSTKLSSSIQKGSWPVEAFKRYVEEPDVVAAENASLEVDFLQYVRLQQSMGQ